MKKTIKATITSLKMQKTAVVEIVRYVAHPLYKKLLKRTKNYKVAIGDNAIEVGDSVLIEQTAPQSKDKHFKIAKVLKNTKQKQELPVKPKKKIQSKTVN